MFRSRNYGASTSFRTESIALFAAMTVQLSDSQKAVVNYAIDQWITSGVWAATDRIWVPCLVTQQQSLLNWKNPAGTALTAFNFASTFVSKIGFPGVAANSTYLLTDYTPSTNGSQYTLNNAKVLAYIKNNIQDDGYTLGAISGGDILMRQRDTGDVFTGYINGAEGDSSSVTDGSGLFSIETNGTTTTRRRNGTIVGSPTTFSPTTICSGKQILYAWNDGGDVATNFIDGNTIQCVMYGNNTISDASVKLGVEYLLANL